MNVKEEDVGKMQKRVRYHLRISGTSGVSAAEDEALWEVIQRGGFDEVMFFAPHLEALSGGLGTLEECEKCAEGLAPWFERLRGEGIAPSINIWWTVSFSNFPGLLRDQREQFDFRWAVATDGKVSRVVACPQDEGWRDHTRRMYGIFAKLEPARMWIDDDVRMTLKGEIYSACFCEACLVSMEERTGRSFTREELLAAIMADPPNSIRDTWLEFQSDLHLELIGGLARAVHEVSGQTHMGLMHSHFESHAAEGCNWGRAIEALGEPAVYCRSGIGPYNDATAQSFAAALSNCQLALAAYPEGVVAAPELENYPHSRFSKSMRAVKASLMFSQLLGVAEMTFHIYRDEGRLDLEVYREDPWSGLLKGMKPCLQSVADLGIGRDQFDGVSLYFHEEVCRHTRGVADEPKPIFLYRQRPFDQSLPLLGMATRYGTGKVTAFAGEQICCLSEAERQEVFSRGVLLDGRAAESLWLAGDGALAGVRGRREDASSSHETVEVSAFEGLLGEPINTRWEERALQFEWADAARTISVLRGYDGSETGHGMVLFENELGGRVAVLPYDSQNEVISLGLAQQSMGSAGFLSFARQAQLKAVLEWLNRGPLGLFVPNAPSIYPLLIRQADRLIVGVTNLLPDPVENLTLELGEPGFEIKGVKYLLDDGNWEDLSDAMVESADAQGRAVVQTSLTVDYLETAVLVLT